MNAKFLSLFALFSLVAAQSGSDTATATASGGAAIPSGAALPQCIQDCATQAANTVGCDLATEPTCVCRSDFTVAGAQCVSDCTPEEQAAAIQVQQAVCPAGGVSGSGSALPSVTGSATILPTGPGPVSSATTRPASSGASASVTRPATSAAAGSASGSAANPSSTNAAGSLVAQGAWAMAAGVVGIAVAL